MDLTPLYKKLIPSDQQLPKPKLKETFYDQLNSELEKLYNSIDKCISYTSLIRKEQNLSKIQHSVGLMENLKLVNDFNSQNNVKDNKYSHEISIDEMTHFDGIKKILNRKIKYSQLKINNKKTIFINQNIELQPECNNNINNANNDKNNYNKAKNNNKNFNNKNYNAINNIEKKYNFNNGDFKYDNFNNDNFKNDDQKNVSLDRRMLQETIKLEQKSMNEELHKSLYEIQYIQNMITSELLEQDERIDNIIGVIPDLETLKIDIADNSRFLRRFLCVFVYCSGFVLLYVYLCKKFF
ncbi:hypothetical protein DMUE_1179 [Dictyocoela muelleri]|nr:hypothetical protein DMUE_1179 [Dictyocoela muelleri]